MKHFSKAAAILIIVIKFNVVFQMMTSKKYNYVNRKEQRHNYGKGNMNCVTITDMAIGRVR